MFYKTTWNSYHSPIIAVYFNHWCTYFKRDEFSALFLKRNKSFHMYTCRTSRFKNLLCDRKEQDRNIFNMHIKKKIGKNNCCSIINEPKKNNNWVQSIPSCVSHTEHVFDMKYYTRYNTIRCKNILWKIIVTIMHLGQSVRETVKKYQTE